MARLSPPVRRWLLAGSIALLAAATPSLVHAQITSSGSPGSGSSTSFAGWNIGYALPSGWRIGQSLGRLQILASNSDAGAIFVAPGLYGGPEDAIADLSAFYQQMQMQAFPVEAPRETNIGGLRALTATYASYDQMGRIVHGRYIALFSPHGTGVNMLAMTTPEQMAQLGATLGRLAESVKVSAPNVNRQAIAQLAGRWIYYDGKSNPTTTSSGGSSRSHEEWVVFDGRGGYQWQSATMFSVSTPGMSAGGASGSSENADHGTYTVIGNTLVFKGTKGQLAVDFQTDGQRLMAAGKTFVRQ